MLPEIIYSEEEEEGNYFFRNHKNQHFHQVVRHTTFQQATGPLHG
jgi:hypothetical protein